MTTTTHIGNISANVYLDPNPAPETGFGVVLLLVPLATNSLNGVRVAEYADLEEATAANTAGYISATTLAQLTAGFAQRPKPEKIKVGYVDIVGGETYATGLTACRAYDADFYGVCIQPRTDAEIVLVSDAVENASDPMLFCFQHDEASALDAGVPAGVSTITDNERTIACYHPSDAAYMDIAVLVNRLRFDPDERSAPWHAFEARGVTEYATVPTTTQRSAAIANNYNLGLPYGPLDFAIDPGVTFTGRPVDEMVSADWFRTRIREKIAELVTEHGERGEKIVVDKTGQKKILAVIESLLEQGVAAGHFVAGQTSAVAEDITDDDLDDRQMRFTVRAQFAVSGRLFVVNAYFSRSPIADDE